MTVSYHKGLGYNRQAPQQELPEEPQQQRLHAATRGVDSVRLALGCQTQQAAQKERKQNPPQYLQMEVGSRMV